MVVMHDDVMRFDSDKFDEIDVDWEDIDDLRLARPRVFRRKGRRTYAGMGELRDGVIRILTADGEQVEFPKGELVSIVSIVYTGEQELRNWRLRIGANLTTRAGNTDEQDISATAQIHRIPPSIDGRAVTPAPLAGSTGIGRSTTTAPRASSTFSLRLDFSFEFRASSSSRTSSRTSTVVTPRAPASATT